MSAETTRLSRSFNASSHCLPSPDGELVATLTSTGISIRRVRSLQVANVVKLPRDLSPPFLAFTWSPSSRGILVASANQIHVFSVLDSAFHAVVRHPLPPGVNPGFACFGPSDAEVCMISSLGLKLSLFNLASSKAVEIANPKLYSVSTASRGFSFRPRTGHLAVLTRTQGKDVASIHHPHTRDCLRSWNLDTVDAHGLGWSPDGRWLVAWEGSAHGHKVLFYTPDGNLFKAWSGPHATPAKATAIDAATRVCHDLGPGVKLLQFSADASRLALADFGRTVCLMDMTTAVQTSRLSHPASIVPAEGLQVWQELGSSPSADAVTGWFIKSKQTLLPAGHPSSEKAELKTGPCFMSFDSSSALLATVLGDWPGTLWVWDVQAAALRAAVLFHSNISSLSWHPSIPETLLIRCEGSQHASVAFVWDPLSQGPMAVDFLRGKPPPAKSARHCKCLWLDLKDSETPALFFSDGTQYILGSLCGSEGDSTPWRDASGGNGHDESLLDLISASSIGGDASDDESLEDTFHFRRNICHG